MGIPVDISTEIEIEPNKKFSIEFIGEEVTFTTVMNAISRKLNGVWGWSDNKAFITLPNERSKNFLSLIWQRKRL